MRFISFYLVLAFRNPNVGKNGKIESTESVHEKRNAKVAQTDGNFKVSVCAVAVVDFLFVICWFVTIETAMTTTAATAVVTTEHDSMTHACIDFEERETIKHFFHRMRASAV